MAVGKKPACGFIPGTLMPTGNVIPARPTHSKPSYWVALSCKATQPHARLGCDLAFAQQASRWHSQQNVPGAEYIPSPAPIPRPANEGNLQTQCRPASVDRFTRAQQPQTPSPAELHEHSAAQHQCTVSHSRPNRDASTSQTYCARPSPTGLNMGHIIGSYMYAADDANGFPRFPMTPYGWRLSAPGKA